MSVIEPMDAAIAWHVRLSDPAVSADSWAAFTDWLEADPANANAYDIVAGADAYLTDTISMTRADPHLPKNDNEPAEVSWFRRRSLLAVAGVAALAALVSPVLMSRPDFQTIMTKSGESRVIALTDGSSIALNGSTSLVIDGNAERFARLVAGEAVFNIRHDADRPFIVEAGGATLRDIGTIFNVRQDVDGLDVSVSEGAVEYAGRTAVTVSAGNQLRIAAGGGDPVLSPIDSDAVGGWRRGRLVYQEARLSAIAVDLGRTLGSPVTVSPGLADRRFSGVIQVNVHPDAVFKRVESLLGVSARKTDAGWELAP